MVGVAGANVCGDDTLGAATAPSGLDECDGFLCGVCRRLCDLNRGVHVCLELLAPRALPLLGVLDSHVSILSDSRTGK